MAREKSSVRVHTKRALDLPIRRRYIVLVSNETNTAEALDNLLSDIAELSTDAVNDDLRFADVAETAEAAEANLADAEEGLLELLKAVRKLRKEAAKLQG